MPLGTDVLRGFVGALGTELFAGRTVPRAMCLEMAMGTRNLNTRWVLPDKDAGMERILYPWVRYWVKFSTHRV
jgi:hypothetical protein